MRKRCAYLLVFVCLAAVLGLLSWMLQPQLNPAARVMVGTWQITAADTGATTMRFTFYENGRFVREASGPSSTSVVSGRWRVAGGSLVIEDKWIAARVVDKLLTSKPVRLGTAQYALIAVDRDSLTLGHRNRRLVLRRAANDP